jgi:hypothetical protein
MRPPVVPFEGFDVHDEEFHDPTAFVSRRSGLIKAAIGWTSNYSHNHCPERQAVSRPQSNKSESNQARIRVVHSHFYSHFGSENDDLL